MAPNNASTTKSDIGSVAYVWAKDKISDCGVKMKSEKNAAQRMREICGGEGERTVARIHLVDTSI
ncbi:hypothetical protein GN958_ATG12599 [Phytophthora infestans]|uniref:Uncharacterized protein n=1 Tax=Phytophthora infestans TaxID=4787 RepID=A0A8S9UG54_PHYIN|nr:hypothetical protein GN958_ATG12599 [Phytophthora infestans]